MDFGLNEQEKALQQEVRDFLRKEVTAELIKETGGGSDPGLYGPGTLSRRLIRQMGERHWLSLVWPRQYGGLERSFTEQLVVFDELSYFRVFYRYAGIVISGPTILIHGSEEQRKEYLPRIARGEIDFALGYTEPEAGSDLAKLQMRAVEDGDYFVFNGQKVFNSACHFADYHWLAARTDTTVPKHRGISLFAVDLKTPGITIRPLWAMGNLRTNEVFYDNVRVPKKNMIGEKNKGWHYVTTALNFERLYATGDLRRDLEDLVTYVKEMKGEEWIGTRTPRIRHMLSEAAVSVEIARLLSFRIAWLLDRGETSMHYQAAVCKEFGDELRQHIANLGVDMLGPYGLLEEDSPRVQCEGRWPKEYQGRVMKTIGAGTTEIQKNIIAIRGLALPRG